jgi:hypothetical protein
MQGADVRATQLIEHSRSERLRKDYPAYDVLCNVYESLKSGGRADEAILARVSGMEFAMRTLINIAESRARHSA